MKKFLALVLMAVLALGGIGCEPKKTTTPAPGSAPAGGSSAPAGK